MCTMNMLALVVMGVLVIAPGIHSDHCDAKELYGKYNYEKVEHAQIGSKAHAFRCKDNHTMKGKPRQASLLFPIQCIMDSTTNAAKWDLDTLKLTKCEPICSFLHDAFLGKTNVGEDFIFEADTLGVTIRCSPGYYWPNTNADEVTDLTCENGELTSNGKLVKCERNNICTNTTANAASAASAGVDVSATNLKSGKYPCKSGYQNKLGQNKTELEMTCYKNVWTPAISGQACDDPIEPADVIKKPIKESKKEKLPIWAFIIVSIWALASIILFIWFTYSICKKVKNHKEEQSDTELNEAGKTEDEGDEMKEENNDDKKMNK